MEAVALPLFPEPGLDQSVLTPVLIGVIVSWLFTETLGWTFVGLVVPGYLAAIFMIHPAAGCIEIVEVMLTYALARAFGETLPRHGLGFRIFGRERFLLVIVASLLVRVAVEAIALPAMFGAAPWAYAMGFVVVPLAANACWKTGLARGLVQHGVPTIVTFVALRFLLVPFTNLSLAGFELLTQDVAGSFLASPKAYLVLLTTATIASIVNVRFGWDFGGVLVPSLLALGCFEPRRVAATLIEAALVALLGAGLGRVIDLEGPRKLVAFFGVEYMLRFVVGHALGRSVPGAALAELGGLGYLLPSLLAVKLASRGALVVLPTAVTTLFGFFAGSGLATAIALVDPEPPPPPRRPEPSPASPLDLHATRDAFDGVPVASLQTTAAAVRTVRSPSRVEFALASDAQLDAPALAVPVPLPDRGVLRVRVTAPLLRGATLDRRDVASNAVALGYRAVGGGDTTMLLGDGRPLALWARPRAASRAVIVACLQAQDRGLRDAAHRLALAVDADMLLLLAAEGGFDESMRTALDLVRGGDPVAFLTVRGERPDAPGTTMGVVGDGGAFAEKARAGLRAFGIDVLDVGPDRVARRITGGFDRDDVVIGFHFDPVAQAALSLTPLRKAQSLVAAATPLPAYDRFSADALAFDDLAATSETWSANETLALLRMTARDESATAARELRHLVQSGLARLALVDAPSGPSFLLGARTREGLMVAQANAGVGSDRVHTARRIDECAPWIKEGETCLVAR